MRVTMLVSTATTMLFACYRAPVREPTAAPPRAQHESVAQPEPEPAKPVAQREPAAHERVAERDPVMNRASKSTTVYVTSGHGEITDPDSVPAAVPERRMTMLHKRFDALGYTIKELDPSQLAQDVPDDAAIVIVLGPTVSFAAAESKALGRYLDAGGRMLLAFDPQGSTASVGLEGKLGIAFKPGKLTDDENFLPQGGKATDKQNVITTMFSAHDSTASLLRSVDKGLVLLVAGALVDAPHTAKGVQPTKTITIRSDESSYLDLNNNLAFDRGEKRQRWSIAAAIEGPAQRDRRGFRVLVFSDADLFADALIAERGGRARLVMVSGPLLDDSVKWLGG